VKNLNKKPKILLVEDDDAFRKVLAKTLANDFQVIEAENGLIAQKIFDALPDEIQIVISDIKMPEMDGISLLKHVRQVSNTIPFIVMTGFSELLESKSAYELGATGFLPKPLKTAELLVTIQSCLSPSSQPQKSTQTNYHAVNIEEFMSSSHLHSDIYLNLGPNHFVKVAHKGETVSHERLRAYRINNVRQIYVTEADLKLYADVKLKAAEGAVANPVSNEKKLLLLKRAAEVLTQVCFLDQVDEIHLQAVNKVVSNAIEIVSDDQQIVHLLTGLSALENPLYAHSVAVAIFSCLTGKQMGWTSKVQMHKLTLCGLFHDIGKQELPLILSTKSASSLTPNEISQLETHTIRGTMVLQISGLPDEVQRVAFEHHEKMNGTGYPRKLRADQIHPYSRIIHAVDKFVNYIMPLRENEQKLNLQDAIKTLATIHRDEIDPKVLISLAGIFKMEELVTGVPVHNLTVKAA
jgi:putative nucleotidyltransferase with HDIG domain